MRLEVLLLGLEVFELFGDARDARFELVHGVVHLLDLAGELVTRGGEVWNLYGPTETTIWSCVDRVGADSVVTIGHPIANDRDEDLAAKAEEAVLRMIPLLTERPA